MTHRPAAVPSRTRRCASLVAAVGVALASLAGSGCASSASGPEAMQQRIVDLEGELAEMRLRLAEAQRDAAAEARDAAVEASPADGEAMSAAEADAMRAELEVERRRREQAEAEARRLEALAGLPSRDEQAALDIEPRFTTSRSAAGETVAGPSVRVQDSRGILKLPHFLRVGFDRPGEGEPATRVWGHVDAFGFTTRRYAGIEEVSFIVDGSERIAAPVAEFDVIDTRTVGSPKARNTTYDMRLTFELDAASLSRLASAQRVTMMLGSRATELDREHLALFLAIDRRLER